MSEKVNPKDIEVRYGSGGDAQGVYVKGVLVHANDYGTDEKVYHLLGVEVVYDSDFMLGQGRWDGAAKTLQEIEDYARERDTLFVRAAQLEEEAERLRQEAKALRERV
jgi:hypothetical protein